MTSKVLILGCTGEVGYRMTSKLLALGFKVHGVRGSQSCRLMHFNHTCIQADLLNPNIDLGIYDMRPELLIHTAWITKPGVFWNSPLNKSWVESSKRIIRNFKESGGKKLVFTSSCAEYSWNHSNALRENFSEKPNTLYGESKHELLNWVKNQNLPFLWTRTFFQFGMTEVQGRLIPSIIDNLLVGKEFMIMNRRDIRDFIYIEDVVKILFKLIMQEQSGVFNLGTGTGIKVETVASVIAKFTGNSNLLKFTEQTQPESTVLANSEKLLAAIGDFAWTEFDIAISKSVDARRRNKLISN